MFTLQYKSHWKCYFNFFGNLILPTLKWLLCKKSYKNTLFMTDFWSSYEVLLLDKMLPMWQFRKLHESLFSLLNNISAAF